MLGYSTGSTGINTNNGGQGISLNQSAFGNAIIGDLSIGNTNQTGTVGGTGGTTSQDFKFDQGGAEADKKKEGETPAAAEEEKGMSKLSEMKPMAEGLMLLNLAMARRNG